LGLQVIVWGFKLQESALVWVVAGLDPQEEDEADDAQDKLAVLVKIWGNSLLVLERREGLRWWY